MGSILTRNDGRLVIQWIDGTGRQRQETVKATAQDGKRLSQRAAEQVARRRLAELEEKARRQRHGLEPLPSESLCLTFGALVDWWWDQHGKTLRSPTVRPFLERHLRPKLGGLPLREVTTARLRKLLADKSSELGPKSLNELRAFVHNVFEVARDEGGPWEGRVNPAAAVDRRRVPTSARKILAPEEWEPVLAHLPSRLRGPVAVGLYAGLREGEIFGLRKEDVDLAGGVLTVSRSWDAPRTKDAKAAPVPIAPELRPRLEEALRSKGPLLFPRPDGSMYPRDLRLGKPLRAAIARAGLIEGYEHRCRAGRCGWRERRPDADVAEACPRCGRPTLWAKPVPRHVTFHGTRHSFGTALVRSAGTAVAQKALRHSDVRLTIHTYGHLDVEDVRAGLAKATSRTASGLQAASDPAPTPPAPLLRTAPPEREDPATPQESRGQEHVGETGFEPATPWSRDRPRGVRYDRLRSGRVRCVRNYWGRGRPPIRCGPTPPRRTGRVSHNPGTAYCRYGSTPDHP
jgi:integrase